MSLIVKCFQKKHQKKEDISGVAMGVGWWRGRGRKIQPLPSLAPLEISRGRDRGGGGGIVWWFRGSASCTPPVAQTPSGKCYCASATRQLQDTVLCSVTGGWSAVMCWRYLPASTLLQVLLLQVWTVCYSTSWEVHPIYAQVLVGCIPRKVQVWVVYLT